jgi:putative transposase
VPRDREGSFEPRLIAKGQTRLDGLDDKIIALYARGMSVRDIRGHLEELYGLEVSPDLISRVTDAVLDEVKEWRARALDAVYPVVIFDALRVKIRDKDSRIVRNKAVYLALGITADGQREVLGMWIAETEGAKFWLSVMNELRNRGVQDILMAVVDGLKGFPEAINAAFPETIVQTCIVHLVRHTLNLCSWKDRKAVAARLREVYGAETAEAARDALEAFDAEWGKQYPSIAQAWRRAWEQVIPFFAFSPEIRRVIYTTNAVESLNRVIRKAIKTRGSFPSEQAAEKLIYLAIRGHEKTSRTVRGWLTAVNQSPLCSRSASPRCRAESGHSRNRAGGRYTEFLTLLPNSASSSGPTIRTSPRATSASTRSSTSSSTALPNASGHGHRSPAQFRRDQMDTFPLAA